MLAPHPDQKKEVTSKLVTSFFHIGLIVTPYLYFHIEMAIRNTNHNTSLFPVCFE